MVSGEVERVSTRRASHRLILVHLCLFHHAEGRKPFASIGIRQKRARGRHHSKRAMRNLLAPQRGVKASDYIYRLMHYPSNAPVAFGLVPRAKA